MKCVLSEFNVISFLACNPFVQVSKDIKHILYFNRSQARRSINNKILLFSTFSSFLAKDKQIVYLYWNWIYSLKISDFN